MPHLSEMNTSFLRAMGNAMYRYEAQQVLHPELLTNAEIEPFYRAYLAGDEL